jgi:putative transposase
MTYDPDRHHRRAIRLKSHDYAESGLYFVTICLQNRACLLGDITDGVLRLTEAGQMVEATWAELPTRFRHTELDSSIAMPNHFHAIIEVVGAPLVGALDEGQVNPMGRAPTRGAPALGAMIGAFKSLVTNAYIRGVEDLGWRPFSGRLWQRNFYEHIIRTEEALEQIRDYIRTNPLRWDRDSENPDRPQDREDDFALWLARQRP